MLRFVSKNLRQKRSHGFTFSLLFFILCLLNANTVLAATVTLTWNAPTTNSDNTALTDLSGYRVYMSTASGQYNSGNIVKYNIPASSHNGGVTETTTVDNLPNGTYYFIVTAYDIYGNESGYSNEIQKTTNSSSNNTLTNSAGGDTISGGGCGFVKDDSDRPNSDKGQFAMNIAMLLLSLLLIRMWRLWKPKWASLFMLGVFLLFPNISHAAVNLPWTTTYNCPDWKQSDGLYNVNCDGLTGHGSWITSDGKEEQITSAANYPGGAGGKGQRHWLADAPVDNSGGTRIQFTSPQSELWIRWYMRFQTGFQWNTLIEYKAFIVDMGLGPTQTIIGWRWQDGVGIVVNGNPYDSQLGGWNTTMVNGITDARGNKMSDGQWHLYEVHMKMDTNGNNGIVEYFVDRVRWLYRTDINYGTRAGWSYMVIGDNGGRVANGVPYAYYVDYDDIVISTTGPIGGSLPDKIAPSPASGLW